MSRKNIIIDPQKKVTFNNKADYCVGTGRMGLALTKEYLDQLKIVQEEIGFSYIRGHGLFCDDMAIYQEYEEKGRKKVEYNFTYLDRVMDSYLELNIRPFLELGFMPEKMASGTQTIFYWKGNTTPPADYEKWCDMVKALLNHMIERYGLDTALSFPIEVWNEPNLPGFWENADMQEYFKLFKYSFNAVKSVNKDFKVGGPAVCGVMDELWIDSFMQFVSKEKLKIDFITRHHYTSEFPEKIGHYDYIKLMNAEDGFKNLQITRDIVDKYPEYKGLPIHITEFNTSYTPKGVIHDTNLNAAFLAQQLSRLGDMNESYSYWTFGDVFEEQGVPFSIFSGDFGLVANGCVKKPTFHTFAFYKQLKNIGSRCVYKDDSMVIVKADDGDGYAGIIWNLDPEKTRELAVSMPVPTGEYAIVEKVVDPDTCNPLKLWHDLGEHANPQKAELELLRKAAEPMIRSEHFKVANKVKYSVDVKPDGVVFFKLTKATTVSDRGYNYKKVMNMR